MFISFDVIFGENQCLLFFLLIIRIYIVWSASFSLKCQILTILAAVYIVISFFAVCIAVADVIVTPTSAINSSYDAMFSSSGLTFPSSGDVEVVDIYMTLSDQFNDISNMSVRVDNAMNFDVVLLGNDIQSTKVDYLLTVIFNR